jgi:hypothetical protein
MFVVPAPAAASFCSCSGRAPLAMLRLLRQYGSARANQRARELATRLSDAARERRSARLDLGLHEFHPFVREPAPASWAHPSDGVRAPSCRLFY